MKKLYSQNLQKTIILLFAFLIFDQLNAQLRIRNLLGFLKPKICNSYPIIKCPANFITCPNASTLPSNTGFATGLPGGPECSYPILTYKDDTLSVGPCAGAIEMMRVWTATDPQNSMLNSSCIQKIILSDLVKPIITNCPNNITVQAGQECKANVFWIPPTVTDNCGKLFLTVNHISGDAFPIGQTTVTYTAEDLCQNITTCSFIITVNGNCCHSIPNITCPANFTSCPGESLLPDHTGYAIAIPGDTLCSIPSISYKDSILTTGPCNGSTKLIRIWKAADPYDPSLFKTCQQLIVLKDSLAPIFSSFPNNITIYATSPDCKASSNWNLPQVSDNCTSLNLSSNFNPGSSFPVGVHTIIYTASDLCGNAIQNSFTITVIDNCCNTPPTIQCPLNYSSCPGTNTDPMITGQPSVIKGDVNCGTPIISYTDSIIKNTSCPGAEMIFRKWKATDPNNSNMNATCVQLIELKDIIPPIYSYCPSNITVNAVSPDCKAVVNWNPPIVSDNCSSINLVSNFNSGSSFSVGIHSIIYTATDNCGNIIQHQFTVTVLDSCCNSAPKINCPSNYSGCPISNCGTSISGTATASPGNQTCPKPIISFRDSLLYNYPGCTNARKFIRIWRATDPINSLNYTECKQIIDLVDNVPPTWNNCPADITVNANGNCNANVSWIPPTASDNCSALIEITSNYNPGQNFPPGTTIVIYSAKDACGNISKHTFTITVLGSGLHIECPKDIEVDRTDPNLPGAYINWNHPIVSTCGNTCKDSLTGFIYMGSYNGSKYYCSKTTETWPDAKNICTNLGGHLAVMNSLDENNFVASKLMGGTAYIGLHDSNIEGNFEWVDNSPLNFTNWYPGQPNNAGGDQDYVELLSDGTWNDQYSNSYREFICEIPCYTIKQIEGLPCGSLFKCGTSKVTYVAIQGNLSDTCSFKITVHCNGSNYCESRGQSCGNLWIKNVSLSNIDNTTGSSGGYAYYPTPCGELKWNKSYNICLTPGFANNIYNAYWKVWIDYNGDGDFIDQDEFVAYGVGTSTICGTITLPQNCQCPISKTRMRVSMAYGSYPGNSCCTFSYGEVEDYCINISTGNLQANNVNSLSKHKEAIELFGSFNPEQWLRTRSPENGLNLDALSLELVPNPAHSNLNISISGSKTALIKIYNAEGKNVLMNKLESNHYQLDIANWENGIYFMLVEDENARRVIRKFNILH